MLGVEHARRAAGRRSCRAAVTHALLPVLLLLCCAAGAARAQLSNSSAAAAAGDVSSADSLWSLRDDRCRRRCVTVATAPLSWCAEQVYYNSFCNRTAAGDDAWSVARLEEAAQAAYMALAFSLRTPPSADCKRAMHKWVCWQARTATRKRACANACTLLLC
jgi:hypothetical protein